MREAKEAAARAEPLSEEDFGRIQDEAMADMGMSAGQPWSW